MATLLTPRLRKSVLVVHLISAGAWIGIDVIVAVLVVAGRLADDAAVRAAAYDALAHFVVWPMLLSGLVCLATGLLLGLATKWGLVRYWWVLVKLVLNVALCVLIVVALQPGMSEVTTYADTIRRGGAAPAEASTLFFPPAVSLSVLTFAVVLAVFKPWGRVRRR